MVGCGSLSSFSSDLVSGVEQKAGKGVVVALFVAQEASDGQGDGQLVPGLQLGTQQPQQYGSCRRRDHVSYSDGESKHTVTPQYAFSHILYTHLPRHTILDKWYVQRESTPLTTEQTVFEWGKY